jgi:DNA-binding PadR family transcriptional regulator
MGEGTIYPALHRLERAGFVRSTHAIAAGRQRRVYRLTRAGRSALARKQSDWRRFEAAIHMVLRGEPSR